jgi:ABC-2 type transport system ATP-binding protein
VPTIESKQGLAVEVQNLAKHYGQLLAVDHVSFAVRNGEFFGFLGPNGAGKTTTVRILTGVIKADGGSASISGYPAGSLKAKQITGVVPDMANPYIELSAWDNLMLMAELYGVPASMARERSAVLLHDLGLLPRKDSLVKTYSKGMKQRLILCMALVSNPEVLFLDEPTSGLDVQSSHLIQDLLRRLNRAGNTIFLTTHNMDEANELCDRIAIIDKGKIVAMDAPEKLRLATSAMHSVEVSFADTVNPEDLARLPGVNTINKMGDKYRLFTAAPGDLVVWLVNYSSSVGLKIVSLNILAPSLEDAFLALTGKVAKDG